MHKYIFWYAPKCLEHNLKEDDDDDVDHPKNRLSNDLTPTASLAISPAVCIVLVFSWTPYERVAKAKNMNIYITKSPEMLFWLVA